MSAKSADGSPLRVEACADVVEDYGGYLVPVDPMEDLQCDSCQ
ncbi:hypothetical protein [Leifsonia sp. Root112D2]|nr:hypothetical protein [Leifsonia sp. Root112D2]